MKKISACPGWLGLAQDRQSFIFLPDKAKVVQKIFQLCVGGVGSYTIAKVLNQQSVPPFGPSPTWDQSTIDNMLRNRATIGEHQPKDWSGGVKKGTPTGKPIANYYPAVVDVATFEAAQRVRKQNLVCRRGRKGERLSNIFAGLTTCFYCSGPVKFHSNGNAKSLICESVIRGNGCIRAGWTYENFEVSVLQFLTHPALAELLPPDHAIVGLTQNVESGNHRFDMRIEIASALQRMVSALRLANAGIEPTSTLPEAQIRRDKPERRFQISLRNGPTFMGTPIFRY
jgi:hypothetical protein